MEKPAATGKDCGPKLGKSGKKVCCSCPETRKVRDNCMVMSPDGEASCKAFIEAHKACLRLEGFDIK